MEREDDVRLIHAVLSGDDVAFNILVEKYQRSVHALAWRKIGDFHYAEEITQDTFRLAYQKLSTRRSFCIRYSEIKLTTDVFIVDAFPIPICDVKRPNISTVTKENPMSKLLTISTLLKKQPHSLMEIMDIIPNLKNKVALQRFWYSMRHPNVKAQ